MVKKNKTSQRLAKWVGLAMVLLGMSLFLLPWGDSWPRGNATGGAEPFGARTDSVSDTTPKGAPDCHYDTWAWDTRARKSVGHREVATHKSRLNTEAIHAGTGCTVCREDQAWVTLGSLQPFAVCKRVEREVRRALVRAMAAGFPIAEISAYRVGLSKGPVDAAGQRTQFSNHSFGIAVDINPGQNGLYARCPEFGPPCVLMRGGPWWPGVPGTITRDSVVYRAFREIGWHWGGELRGRQKDFMHFSLSGD